MSGNPDMVPARHLPRPVLWWFFLACCCLLRDAWAGDLAGTIERVRPGIVMVGVYHKAASPRLALQGTGFVVGDGQLVATAAHVVSKVTSPSGEVGTLVVQARASAVDNRVRSARIVALDEAHDLAVLRIDGPALPALNLGDSQGVREGQMVAFTGFPIGGALGFTPVTHRGMVSAITPIALPSATAGALKPSVLRRLKEGSFTIFQLDGTAYPGNSGGPMFDVATGDVIGVINMVVIKGTREAALAHPSGISYAVPVNFLSELLKEVR